MVVLHLFTDDTLIFCKANGEHLRNFRCLFSCFEAVSGLKINLPKSEIIHIGEMDEVENLARISGCRVALLLMKYLGLPFGGTIQVSFYMEWYVEKIERRLAG